ncbi:MAG: hypothetical protein C0483_18265 [Pirellula sp.]|nr:hypothetical protein [Pirellula sp.]
MTRFQGWRLLRTACAAVSLLYGAAIGKAAAPDTAVVPTPTPSAGAPSAGGASPRPSMPWTVPPQRNSLLEPRPGDVGTSPSSPSAGREVPHAMPEIDLDDLTPGAPQPLRFAGRNGAVLDNGAKGIRQREGARIVERRGRFEVHGDRVIFFAQEPDAHYVVLENLALERVARVVEESGPQLLWSVSGTLSEYRSSNYLMISRAMVKSAPAHGEPGRLSDPTAQSLPVGPALGSPQIAPTFGPALTPAPAAAAPRRSVR